ncbi:MAG: acyl-CoA thioesterase [Cellvibrionales bacterium]|nr:acyl-CoA thioesterase [Cellvibrionales bacterium]
MTNFNENDPKPLGELKLQTVPMPKDTNSTGDIFGGWLMSQMDIAGAIAASQIAKGRVATVAIESMSFMIPVKVGSIVSCYTNTKAIGNSSIQIGIEVWMQFPAETEQQKVTEGVFVFVALDNRGKTRSIPK